MTFNSIVFLFSFLPICLILCYVVPKRFRNVPMLLCSLVFYAWGNPTYLLLMAFSVVFNYLTGLQLAAYQEEERHTGAKVSMICAVVVNLLVLGFFKYYGFLHESGKIWRRYQSFSGWSCQEGTAGRQSRRNIFRHLGP